MSIICSSITTIFRWINWFQKAIFLNFSHTHRTPHLDKPRSNCLQSSCFPPLRSLTLQEKIIRATSFEALLSWVLRDGERDSKTQCMWMETLGATNIQETSEMGNTCSPWQQESLHMSASLFFCASSVAPIVTMGRVNQCIPFMGDDEVFDWVVNWKRFFIVSTLALSA